MSTAALQLRTAPALRLPHPPHLAIARHVERRARLWALIWGFVFGLQVVTQAKGFVALYPTAASRLKLASSLQPYAVLVGPARHTETVAGFVVWKVLAFCAVIAGIWGVRASVGLLRGQEDSGQWEMLLAGPVTRRVAAAQALLGLGAVFAEMFSVVAVFTLVAGSLPGGRFTTSGALLFAVTLVSAGAMFLAIGALCSQLRGQQGEASTLGMLILGGSYLISMVANSRASLGWLRWYTPFGWIEEVNPFRDFQPLALALIAGLTVVCAAAAVFLAGRRDVLLGVLPERAGRERAAWWLGGALSLGFKLSRPGAVAWVIGLSVFGGVFGMLTRATASIYSSTPQLASVMAKLGAHRISEAFLGAMFLMYSVIISVLAASQMAAVRDEEASGRLDNLLVQPVKRLRWLLSRVGLSVGIIVLVGLAVGVSTWAGAAINHSGVALYKCLEAGMNALAPGLFVLGAGVLTFGFRPRLTAVVGYGIVGYSFLTELVGSFVKSTDWVKDSSLFTHIALVPAAAPDWTTDLTIAALGAVAAVVGAAAFQRRDLEYA